LGDSAASGRGIRSTPPRIAGAARAEYFERRGEPKAAAAGALAVRRMGDETSPPLHF
jgi:hypothetical protein